MKAINDYKIATLKVMVIGETKEKKPIAYGYDVYERMKFITKEDRECFYVLHLNAKNEIIGKELVSMGTLTNSLIHPREVFKAAILNNSASIICVHNHPSGDPTPSREDILITNRLVEAGALLGISVLDHVIIGEFYKSLREMYGENHFKSGRLDLPEAIRDVKGKKQRQKVN